MVWGLLTGGGQIDTGSKMSNKGLCRCVCALSRREGEGREYDVEKKIEKRKKKKLIYVKWTNKKGALRCANA